MRCWTSKGCFFLEHSRYFGKELFSHSTVVPRSTPADSRAVAIAVAELKQCSHKRDLQQGRSVHSRCIHSGLANNKFVANTLVSMYSRCGSMKESWETFTCMSRTDVVSWNAIIHGYVANGQSQIGLEMFACMDCPRTAVTFVGAIKACASLAIQFSSNKKCFLEKGLAIQKEASDLGLLQDLVLAGSLVDMYGKCGDMSLAHHVFRTITHKSLVVWNALLMGYVENGQSYKTLDCFTQMDCEPDGVTFVAVLKAVPGSSLERACHFHRLALLAGVVKDIQVANTLVDMYCKCGNMVFARTVFDRMEKPNVVSWTALIMGYVDTGQCTVALELFERMDCAPDGVTFVAALKACTGLCFVKERDSCLRKGVEVHARARDRGFETDAFVASALVDMYSKLGKMDQAQAIFDSICQPSVVLWNTLIAGYVINGESVRALEVFYSMSCAPDRVSLISTLKACAALASDVDLPAALQGCVLIHRLAMELGFQADCMVVNTLVDTYSKCGEMGLAKEVFDSASQRDVFTWTSLILGYVGNRESSVALDLFSKMDCPPNVVTFAAGLKACGCLGALEAGREIHDRISELGLENDERLANSLVDFYGKCGNTDAAEEVFNQMKSRDVVSWNALIGGYSLRGNAPRVFSLVKRMESEQGLRIDSVTMSLILTACSHAGMVDEGKEYFRSMRKYGIRPTVEHCNCLVDVLGRANRLEEAVSVIGEMALEADAVTWKIVLSSCRKWCNLQVGRVAFDALVSLGNPSDIEFATALMQDISRKPL